MNVRTLIALLITATVSNCLIGQEAPKTPSAPSTEPISKPGSPGPQHEKLLSYAGIWSAKIQMGNGNAAVIYAGPCTNRMIVGGRFLQIEYSAKGQAGDTEGVFIAGFDPRHQRHTLIAMDSFGPYFVTSQGQRDEATGQLKLLGIDDDPAMKARGLTKEFIHRIDFRGADEFAIEVWFIDTRTPARREMKFMTYTFTRQK